MTVSAEIGNQEIIEWASASDVYGVLGEQPAFDGLPPASQDKIVAIERKDRVELIRTAIGCTVIDRVEQISEPEEKIHRLAAVGVLPETIPPVSILYKWEATTHPYQKSKLRDFRALQDRIEDAMPHLNEREQTRLLGFFWPGQGWEARRREKVARVNERGITFDEPLSLERLTSVKGISDNFASQIIEFLAIITLTEAY